MLRMSATLLNEYGGGGGGGVAVIADRTAHDVLYNYMPLSAIAVSSESHFFTVLD